MKKFYLLIVFLSLVSCGVQIKKVVPESNTTTKPELNSVNVSEIGIKLVSKETGYKLQAIKITKARKSKSGYIVKDINVGDVFVNYYSTNGFKLYESQTDNIFGVAIPTDGSNPKFYTYKGVGVDFIQVKDKIEYQETFIPAPKLTYIKQEFIYNGRVGNGLKFIYREFADDYARPAFTQDLQYDLAESAIIGFRGLRIEVLKASNTSIEYKLLSQFDE